MIKRCFVALSVLGLLGSLVLSTPCLGEEVKEKKDEKNVTLPEVVVIAPSPGIEITPEKTVIKVEEIKKPGIVRTLPDVLEILGGIDVQRTNPLMASPGDQVSLRGLNEDRMVVEIDGRRINFTGHMGRYIVDWSSLNIDDIEKIEIIRGGHSVLHPFAMGGVINLITKKGKKTDELKPDISVFSGYSSYDTYHAGASFDGGIANVIGYHLSLSKQETNGYLRNNFQENNNFNGRVTFWLPKDVRLIVGAKIFDVKYGYPVINDPSRADYNPDYPKLLPSADQLRHIPPAVQPMGPFKPYWKRNGYYLDISLDLPLGPGKVHFLAHQNYGDRKDHFYSDIWGKQYNELEVKDRTRGIIAEYQDVKLFKDHTFTFGLDYQELGDPDSDPRIYIIKSAYFQDVITLLNGRVVFTPGIRYTHIDKDTYFAWFETGKTRPAFPQAGKKQEDEGFFPSFKIDFQVTPNTALYVFVSRAYRLPCP